MIENRILRLRVDAVREAIGDGRLYLEWDDDTERVCLAAMVTIFGLQRAIHILESQGKVRTGYDMMRGAWVEVVR